MLKFDFFLRNPARGDMILVSPGAFPFMTITNAQSIKCRIIHRIGLAHEDRLTLLVAVLNWAETNGLTLRNFHSHFMPVGEFSFTVQIQNQQMVDDLFHCLPLHAVGDVEINGQSQQLPSRSSSQS